MFEWGSIHWFTASRMEQKRFVSDVRSKNFTWTKRIFLRTSLLLFYLVQFVKCTQLFWSWNLKFRKIKTKKVVVKELISGALLKKVDFLSISWVMYYANSDSWVSDMFITSRTSFTSRTDELKAYILATILNFLRKYPKEFFSFFLLKIVLFRVLRSAYHKSELAGWTKAFWKWIEHFLRLSARNLSLPYTLVSDRLLIWLENSD